MDVRREKTDVRWVGFHPLVFVPGKPFRHSKGEAYLKEAHNLGKLLALPINVKLGWEGMPGTNTLAKLEKLLKYGGKTFITLALGRGTMRSWKLVKMR